MENHFRRPLALRSPASRLGLPSSVEDVVGSVCPQRAISACSPTEAATASSQPFISSWRKKQGRVHYLEERTLSNKSGIKLPSLNFSLLIY